MRFLSVRLGGVELCLTRSDTPFAGATPQALLQPEGELYVHWLNYEVILSLAARIERRRKSERNLPGARSNADEAKESESAEIESGRDPTRRAPSGNSGGVQEA